MARLAGVELQDNWKVDYALTRIKGLGWALSKKIISELNIDPSLRVSSLTSDDLAKIASAVEKYPIEGELIRKIKADVNRLQVIGSYRGSRHSRNLPVRGQRTRRNARTKRGKRKTIGAFKKEMLAKMAAANKESKK
ncbi:MAG: 30S ribosomal protein S13 [Patescibacteria group bacterium]|nr:30S ribosomal protein S13 [Patescibacteria group bacterium]